MAGQPAVRRALGQCEPEGGNAACLHRRPASGLIGFGQCTGLPEPIGLTGGQAHHHMVEGLTRAVGICLDMPPPIAPWAQASCAAAELDTDAVRNQLLGEWVDGRLGEVVGWVQGVGGLGPARHGVVEHSQEHGSARLGPVGVECALNEGATELLVDAVERSAADQPIVGRAAGLPVGVMGRPEQTHEPQPPGPRPCPAFVGGGCEGACKHSHGPGRTWNAKAKRCAV